MLVMTDLLIAPQLTDPEAEQEEPKEAHIVSKEDQMRGYIEGSPITALCGRVWVPSRDYTNLPVCERCKETLAQIQSARGGMN